MFDQYVAQYRSPRHNGATLVLDHLEWISRLESCVVNYPGLRELVLVSNTTQKLFPLIVPALARGLLVRVYSSHPDTLSGRSASAVESLRDRLADEIAGHIGSHCPGRAELRYFRHVPTFRAAVIGDSVLGLQAYIAQPNVSAPTTPRQAADPQKWTSPPLVPADMRLIVTKHGEHFQRIRKMVDLQCDGADAEPYDVLGSS